MRIDEQKDLIEEGDEAAVMLRGLGRVEAPADFGMRVKARIAARREAASHGFAWVRYLIPAAAPLLLLAIFYIAFVRPAADTPETSALQVPDVPQAFVPVEPQPAAGNSASATPADDIATVQAQAPRTANSVPSPVRRAPDTSVGGSEDRAATAADDAIFPPGIRPDKPVVPLAADTGEFNVRELLSMLGIRAASTADGWKVDSVEPQGTAYRSGVKAGDVVTSFNSESIVGRSVLRGPANVSYLRVRRGGAEIEVQLKR